MFTTRVTLVHVSTELSHQAGKRTGNPSKRHIRTQFTVFTIVHKHNSFHSQYSFSGASLCHHQQQWHPSATQACSSASSDW